MEGHGHGLEGLEPEMSARLERLARGRSTHERERELPRQAYETARTPIERASIPRQFSQNSCLRKFAR